MLIELFGENFGCFRDEFRLSMLATDIDPGSQRGVIEVPIEGDSEPLRLLRAAAIYGPNASGKSTVLHAANVFGHLIENSATFRSDQGMPGYIPFSLDATTCSAPTRLGVRAVMKGRVYEYELQYDKAKVWKEALTQIGPDPDKDQVLFIRDQQSVDGAWREHEEFQLLTKSFRPNALLLSLADSLSPSLATDIAVRLLDLLDYRDPSDSPMWRWTMDEAIAGRAESDQEFAEWLRMRLPEVDFGVVDYETKEIRWADDSRSGDEDSDEPRSKKYRLQLLHGSVEGPTPIPYGRESRGTKRFLQLTPFFFLLSHSEEPLAYFLDELDASLHPILLERLVHHFNCDLPADQVKGQLIFATHATELVDDEARKATLRRDQVYFTEKDESGAARLYSLAEFSERNNLNIRRRYLQGRYGALPSLGDFSEK